MMIEIVVGLYRPVAADLLPSDTLSLAIAGMERWINAHGKNKTEGLMLRLWVPESNRMCSSFDFPEMICCKYERISC